MRYIKMLGLVALTAIAAMAFAASASATTLTSPSGTTYTSKLTAESEGIVSVHGSNGVTIECQSVANGSVEQHGAETTVKGKLSHWTFTSCSGGAQLTINSPGSLELHAVGNGNGTVTTSGAEVEAKVSSIFGTITCIYTTGSGIHLGLLTGNNSSNATLDLSSTIPRTGGSSLCGSTGILTGSYKVTSPSTLSVD